MTQRAVLNYYYHNKIAHAVIIYNSIHKLTWTKTRFNSSFMANAIKGLEKIP